MLSKLYVNMKCHTFTIPLQPDPVLIQGAGGTINQGEEGAKNQSTPPSF